ncbi:hypothetical protein FOCG_17840 [Fusarium oxysporum f. sp. radicis-lycopersici 26381]|nr:hypothetical protein FOCG_17840 [Fusarium oxysporum f. sp. radicis-lycopersici 26381]
MNARGSAISQPNILRNLSLDVTQATLELLLDLGHLIVAAVKLPKTFDTDKADANEAATVCTSGQTRQHLLKSACQDNSRLKVDDVRYARLGRGLLRIDSRDTEPILRIMILEVVTRSTAIKRIVVMNSVLQLKLSSLV